MADNNYTYEVIRKALDRDDDGGTCTPSDVDAAYQALNALLTENARLRAVLKPFADACENVTKLDDDDDIVDETMQTLYDVGEITAGDLIRARIALLRGIEP